MPFPNGELRKPTVRILFLYRIFPIIQFRRILFGAALFVLCLGIALIPVTIWTCTPIHAFWTTLGGGLKSQLGGRCVNTQLFYLVSGAINTVTDFALLALVSLQPRKALFSVLTRSRSRYLWYGDYAPASCRN